MKVIVQAGGKGTRLLQLTCNKPKCLVSINNLPMIYHLFKLFKNDEFIVIGDYKYDVLKKYLRAFGGEYNYKLVRAKEKGTASGIKDCLKYIEGGESFILTWCDLVLPEDFELPMDLSKNYIGISKEYECRWSYVGDKFLEKPSKEDGVAGFFIFKNKKELEDIKDGISFVEDYLHKKNIKFERLNLFNSKEIGTMVSYNQNIMKSFCRPFNSLEITEDNKIIKRGITKQGLEIAEKEANWYKFIREKTNFRNIPNIYSYSPIIMDVINGKNIFEYKSWSLNEKKRVMKQIVDILINLHDQDCGIESNFEDIKDNYVNKVFDRLGKVKNLIPLADKEFIKVNGRSYKNILFLKKELEDVIKGDFSERFSITHGDCTFSNILYDESKKEPILIDPRGYFGKTKVYGDEYYDWAKLYYSFVGNYDQFNRNNFVLKINEDDVELSIGSNGWEELEDYFFNLIPGVDRKKVKLIHSLIWFSLTTYAWNDYDFVCGSFYNGLIKLGEIIEY